MLSSEEGCVPKEAYSGTDTVTRIVPLWDNYTIDILSTEIKNRHAQLRGAVGQLDAVEKHCLQLAGSIHNQGDIIVRMMRNHHLTNDDWEVLSDRTRRQGETAETMAEYITHGKAMFTGLMTDIEKLAKMLDAFLQDHKDRKEPN